MAAGNYNAKAAPLLIDQAQAATAVAAITVRPRMRPSLDACADPATSEALSSFAELNPPVAKASVFIVISQSPILTAS